MAMNSYIEISAIECTYISLNDTEFSHHTKNSGEREYKELAAMISTITRDDKENMSMLSSSKYFDLSHSIISNDEIWKGDRSCEDSKNFIENFKKIDEKKKKKINKESNSNLNDNKDLPLKDFSTTVLVTTKEEDYNDDIEESVEFSKNDNLDRLKLNETKNNNLNEIYANPLKFYTSPDDISDYRSSYPYSNFSFTPQSHVNINNMMNHNLMCSPKNYAFPRIPDSYQIYEDSKKNIKQINLSEKKENKMDNYQLNPYLRKYYTPTHHNSLNYINNNDLAGVQKELNFNDLSPFKSNVHINNNPQQSMIQIKGNINQNNSSTINYNNLNNPQPNNYQTYSKSLFDNHMNKPIITTFANKYSGINYMNEAKPFKNEKNNEECFDLKINLENILMGKDKRTFLMIRNVPNRYSLSNIVDEINTNFMGKYDYINLPIDQETKKNLGYAFINFVDSLHIVLFYDTYFNKKWNKYRSDKKIELNYAEKQSKKDVSCNDESTYFASEDKKVNFSKINAKIEIPYKFYEIFKKNYPNSVCIIENKNSITFDKRFYVKTMGKR